MTTGHWMPLIAVLSCLAFVPSAVAQDEPPCNATVLDATTKHVLGDQSATKSAANKLAGVGAKVHVWALQSAGGNLDAYYRATVERCTNWQDANGNADPGLVAVILTMDRQLAVYYGHDWDKALDGKTGAIKSDMGSKFRSGKFDEGLALGANKVHDQIYDQQHPTNWLAIIMYVFIGVLAIGLFFFVRSRRRKAAARERERKTAQQSAIKSFGTATSRAEALATLRLTVTNQVDALTTRCGAEHVHDLVARWSSADRAASDLGASYDLIDGVPGVNTYTTERYDSIDAASSDLLGPLQAATDELEAVQAECRLMNSRIENLGETIAEARTRLTGVQAYLAAQRGEGYRVGDADAMFDAADAGLSVAAEHLVAERLGLALGAMAKVEQCLDSATSAAGKPKQQRDELARTQGELERRHVAAASALADAQATAKALRDEFGPRLQITDHPDTLAELGQRLETAKNQLGQARSSASMERQDWEAAAAQQRDAETHLELVSSACEEVEALARTLREAKDAIGPKLQKVQTGTTRALEGLGSISDGAEDDAYSDLTRLQDDVTEIDRLLKLEYPDYGELGRRVDALDRRLREVLSDFRQRREAQVQRYCRQQGVRYDPNRYDDRRDDMFGGMGDLAFLMMVTGDNDAAETMLGVGLMTSGSPFGMLAGLSLLDQDNHGGGHHDDDRGWSGHDDGGSNDPFDTGFGIGGSDDTWSGNDSVDVGSGSDGNW